MGNLPCPCPTSKLNKTANTKGVAGKAAFWLLQKLDKRASYIQPYRPSHPEPGWDQPSCSVGHSLSLKRQRRVLCSLISQDKEVGKGGIWQFSLLNSTQGGEKYHNDAQRDPGCREVPQWFSEGLGVQRSTTVMLRGTRGGEKYHIDAQMNLGWRGKKYHNDVQRDPGWRELPQWCSKSSFYRGGLGGSEKEVAP